MSRVHTLDAVHDESGNGKEGRSFNLKTDLSHLGELLEELGDVALVVIDPISAYLGNTDSHKNADTRALLAPLGKLAEKYQVAIVCVSHLNKNGSTSEAQLRVTGSLAFVAASRAAFIVAGDPNNPRRRFLLPAKNNLSNDETGFAFAIESHRLPAGIETSFVIWEAEAVTVRLDEVLAPEAVAGNPAQREAATEWLLELLSEGPLPAKEVRAQADEAGLAWRTVRRAKDDLGIKPKKDSFEGGWTWALPANMAKPAQDDQPEAVTNFEDVGHLAESVEDCTADASETPLGASREVSEEVASNG